MNFFVGAQTCDQFMILSVFGPGPSKNDFQYRALQTLANNVYFNNKLEWVNSSGKAINFELY